MFQWPVSRCTRSARPLENIQGYTQKIKSYPSWYQKNNATTWWRPWTRESDFKKPCEWEAFRVLRRKVKSAIKSSESQLIRNKISKSRDNKTSIWKTNRNRLNPGRRSILPYSRDCNYVAHEFNHFFVPLGENTSIKTQRLTRDYNLWSNVIQKSGRYWWW